MLLSDLKSDFVDSHYRGISPTTSIFLDACVGSYSRHLARDASTNDLNQPAVNHYIDWMTANRAYDTMRSQRSGLLMIWRHGADVGLVDRPNRIRLPRKKQRPVRAWSMEEVASLRDHCLSLTGVFSHGIGKGIYSLR